MRIVQQDNFLLWLETQDSSFFKIVCDTQFTMHTQL